MKLGRDTKTNCGFDPKYGAIIIHRKVLIYTKTCLPNQIKWTGYPNTRVQSRSDYTKPMAPPGFKWPDSSAFCQVAIQPKTNLWPQCPSREPLAALCGLSVMDIDINRPEINKYIAKQTRIGLNEMSSGWGIRTSQTGVPPEWRP